MKRFLSVVAAAGWLLGCGGPVGVSQAASAGQGAAASALQGRAYANPLIDADFPDPMVLKASDGYHYAYATGTFDGQSRRHISVSRSKDMKAWEPLREALPAKPAWAAKKENFWAPHVIERQGTFYMYLAIEPDWSESEHMRLAVATAKSPLGPFTVLGEPLDTGDAEENLDAMAFDDPASGKPYMYWGRNGVISVQELASDRLRFAPGSRPQELLHANEKNPYENIVEGPYVTAANGWYYMYYSGDDCCVQAHYAVMVARSKSPTGPFEKLADATGRADSVILKGNAKWNAPGHNAVFRDASGADWLIYHAVDTAKPVIPATKNIRRPLLMDRITYVNGWPTLRGGTPSTTRQAPMETR